MSEQAFPQAPEVVWWSGDRAICVRVADVRRDGTDYKLMYLILHEQTKWRYGIDDRKLNYELSGDGVYIQEYPSAHFHKCTDNPENPMIIMTCNFDGTESFGNDFIELKNEIARKNAFIRSLQGEIKTLSEELKVALERVRSLKKQAI